MTTLYHGSPVKGLHYLQSGSWLTDKRNIAFAYGRQKCFELGFGPNAPVYLYQVEIDNAILFSAVPDEGDFQICQVNDKTRTNLNTKGKDNDSICY